MASALRIRRRGAARAAPLAIIGVLLCAPFAAAADFSTLFAAACQDADLRRTPDGVAAAMAARGYAPTANPPFSIAERTRRLRGEVARPVAEGVSVEETALSVAVYANADAYVIWELSTVLISPAADFQIESHQSRCTVQARRAQDFERTLADLSTLFDATSGAPFDDATHQGFVLDIGEIGLERLEDQGARTIRHVVVMRERVDPTAVSASAIANVVALK